MISSFFPHHEFITRWTISRKIIRTIYISLAQSAWAEEYTDYLSAEEYPL